MTICKNCGHANPAGATQCEACYDQLAATSNCSSCGTAVAADAMFCPQCGTSLRAYPGSGSTLPPTNVVNPSSSSTLPPTNVVNPGSSHPLPPTNVVVPPASSSSTLPPTNVVRPYAEPGGQEIPATDAVNIDRLPPTTDVPEPPSLNYRAEDEQSAVPEHYSPSEQPPDADQDMTIGAPVEFSNVMPTVPPLSYPSPNYEAEDLEPTLPLPQNQEFGLAAAVPTPPPRTQLPQNTQLQITAAHLLHVQTNTRVELPTHLNLIRIGKPNDRIPPDIDVSGFPDSSIVSRVHADIRVEGDSYFLEDAGSANGTYVNNLPLRPGDRYRLRPGDRVCLGKEDKVSFIFQKG